MYAADNVLGKDKFKQVSGKKGTVENFASNENIVLEIGLYLFCGQFG